MRGVAFQHAQAVLSALDVIESSRYAVLEVEGQADIIDIAIWYPDGQLATAKQAKTRAEPYVWRRLDIVRIIRRWMRLSNIDGATFEFLTDGHLHASADALRRQLAEIQGLKTYDTLSDLLFGDDRERQIDILQKVSIISRAPSAQSLMQEAEHKILTLRPPLENISDALTAARVSVHELLRHILIASGEKTSENRRASRQHLAQIADINLDYVDHGTDLHTISASYIETIKSGYTEPSAFILPKLHSRSLTPPALRDEISNDSSEMQNSPFEIAEIISHEARCVAISAATGTGKTTAIKYLEYIAAMNNVVVVTLSPEDYRPGQLFASLASAIGARVGVAVPRSTGEVFAHSSDVLIAFDGVSELPLDLQQALRIELQMLLNAPQSAKLILLGRNPRQIRTAVPMSVDISSYSLHGFTPEEYFEYCRLKVAGHPDSNQLAHDLQERITLAVDSGTTNPLLVSMAANLILSGVSAVGRAELYHRFIESMALRTNSPPPDEPIRVLGSVFSSLIDSGRRYTDSFTWKRLLGQACENLTLATSYRYDAQEIEKYAYETGIITSSDISQTVTAMHDSIADYLAGLAIAEGLVELPAQLTDTDRTRVVFACEISNNVPKDLQFKIVRDLPLLGPRISGFDHCGFDANAPKEVSNLMDLMFGPLRSMFSSILLHRGPNSRTYLAMGPHGGISWSDEIHRDTHKIITVDGGPLRAVYRAWETALNSVHASSTRSPESAIVSAEDAQTKLTKWSTEYKSAILSLVSAMLNSKIGDIALAEIGHLGITGIIGKSEHYWGDRSWTLNYIESEAIDIRTIDETGPGAMTELLGEFAGSTSVEHYVYRDPTIVARDRILRALVTLSDGKLFLHT